MTMKAAKKLADGMRGGKKLIFTEQAFDDYQYFFNARSKDNEKDKQASEGSLPHAV